MKKIILCFFVFFLLVMFGFASCSQPNNKNTLKKSNVEMHNIPYVNENASNKNVPLAAKKNYALAEQTSHNKEKICLSINTDAYITCKLKDNIVKIESGTLWRDIKDVFSTYIQSDNNKYTFIGWKLEKRISAENIKDEFLFNKDTSLFCFSKLNNKDELAKLETMKKYREMQEVNPPAAGIIGHKSDAYIPGTSASAEGVFIEGRTVKISPYKIAKYELTYGLWKVVYEWAVENGYKFCNKGGASYAKDSDENNLLPVTHIFWRDAIVWCNAYTELCNGEESECVYRISDVDTAVLKDATCKSAVNPYYDKSKKGFRLPTEAEWEYAARYQGEDAINAEKYGSVYLTKLDSFSGARFPANYKGLKPSRLSKDMLDKKGKIKMKVWAKLKEECERVGYIGGRFDGVEKESCTPRFYRVGEKECNALGLYDMSSNIWEFCFDFYGNGNVEKGEFTDPTGASYSREDTNQYHCARSGPATVTACVVVGMREYINDLKIEDKGGYNCFTGIRLAMKL